MKSSIVLRILPLFALFVFSFLSCKKNDNPNTQPIQQTTQGLLMNAVNLASDATNLQTTDMEDILSADSSTDCKTVTFDTSATVYPHTKTVDYGTTGCMGTDGLMRKGKRITIFYADINTAPIGTMISQTTYDSYYVNDISISGTVNTYIDSSSTTDTLITKVVTNRTLADGNGDQKTVTGTNYWKRISGGNTPNKHDDVYQITGGSSGTETLNGTTEMTWTSQTDATNPVIKPESCEYRTQGAIDIQLQVTNGGNETYTEHLDYGSGTCDNTATLSINNGTPTEVTLPLFFWPVSL